MHDVLGIKKKLAKQAKVRGYEELNTWIKSITNHLYWSIDYSSEGGLRTAAFTSLFNHITDIHVHDGVFPGVSTWQILTEVSEARYCTSIRNGISYRELSSNAVMGLGANSHFTHDSSRSNSQSLKEDSWSPKVKIGYQVPNIWWWSDNLG